MTNLQEVLRQALFALENNLGETQYKDTINNIRNALQVLQNTHKQEPVGYLVAPFGEFKRNPNWKL